MWARARIGEHAADLTAEVFARAWLRRSRFRDEEHGSAFPWLLGIAQNVLRESLRKRRIEDSGRRRFGLPRLAAGETELDAVHERLSLSEVERRALASLPQEDRELLRLRVIEERPYREIAAHLECTPQAAAASRLTPTPPTPVHPRRTTPMNDIPEELRLFRSQLLDAIDRDLGRRSPHSRVTQRRSLRLGLPTLAVVAAATVAVVLGLTLSAASPSSAYAAAKKALAATAAASSGTITGEVSHSGSSYTLDTTQWNGDSIAVTRGTRAISAPTRRSP